MPSADAVIRTQDKVWPRSGGNGAKREIHMRIALFSAIIHYHILDSGTISVAKLAV